MLILKLLHVKVMPVYRTFKDGNYSKSKAPTSLSWVSDVVYRFTCPCDTGKTCIGMSSRHSVASAREDLNLNNNRKSAVKDHLQQCKSSSQSEIDLHLSFMFI